MRAMSAGRSYKKLSTQQTEIVQFLKEGKSTKQIADHYQCGVTTVSHHYSVIKFIYGVTTLVALKLILQGGIHGH